MNNSTYPAATWAAARMERLFAERSPREESFGKAGVASPPQTADIEAVIEAAFWASLRREEGFIPKISIALVSPSDCERPLLFESPFALEPGLLARLSPAVERPGVHLGAWRQANGLTIWGATRSLPSYTFVLEVIAPGLLVVKRRADDEARKFINLAVIEGDQVKVLREDAGRLLESPQLVRSLLGLTSTGDTPEPANVLVQLAISMRAHGRGGSLLVVPDHSTEWMNSMVRPLTYTVSPAYSELSQLILQPSEVRSQRKWQEAMRRTLDSVAGLTAIDGATVINSSFDLLAFGAKITRVDDSPRVEQVAASEPIEGSEQSIVHPSQLGGTRHLSAAQFAQDQRDAIALVASQDGRFTIFGWSGSERMVHAHRVETLLL